MKRFGAPDVGDYAIELDVDDGCSVVSGCIRDPYNRWIVLTVEKDTHPAPATLPGMWRPKGDVTAGDRSDTRREIVEAINPLGEARLRQETVKPS